MPSIADLLAGSMDPDYVPGSSALGSAVLGHALLGMGGDVVEESGYVDVPAIVETETVPPVTLDIHVGSINETETVPIVEITSPVVSVMRSIEDEESVPDVTIVRTEDVLRVYIGGVYSPYKPEWNSFRTRYRTNSIAECQMTIYDPDQVLDIKPGTNIQVYRKGFRLFYGMVRDFSYYSTLADVGHFIELMCWDMGSRLDKIHVAGTYDPAVLNDYDKSLKGIIRALWIKFIQMAGEIISFNEVDCPDIAITEPVDFSDWPSFLKALEKLTSLTGTYFTMIETEINVFKADDGSAKPAPFDIADDEYKFRDMKIDISHEDYANRILVRTTTPLSGVTTESFSGNMDPTQYFQLKFEPEADDTPIVKVNGVEKKLVSELTPGGSYDFSWLPGFGGFYPNPSLVPFAYSDVISITYRPPVSNVLIVDDPAAIAAQKAIQGGSGVSEAILDLGDTVTDRATAILYGQNELAKRKNSLVTISYATSDMSDEVGGFKGVTLAQLMALSVGQIQNIDLTSPFVDDVDIVFDSLELSDIDGQYLAITIHGSNGRAKEYWDKQLAKLLSKPTPKPAAIDVYGWGLGMDDPEAIPVGLVPVDEYGSYTVRRDSYLNSMVVFPDIPPTSGYVDVILRHYRNAGLLNERTIRVDWLTGNAVRRLALDIPAKQYDRLTVGIAMDGTDEENPPRNFSLEVTAVPSGSQQTTGYK